MSQMNKNAGLTGVGKQAPVAGKPLTAKATTGFKTAEPAGLKMNKAIAQHKAGSAAFDKATSAMQTGKTTPSLLQQKDAADKKMSDAQMKMLAAKKQGSTSKTPTQGQTIGTRTPPRPAQAAPTKPPSGPGAVLKKILPNAMNKGPKK